jgi:hypothetical protein
LQQVGQTSFHVARNTYKVYVCRECDKEFPSYSAFGGHMIDGRVLNNNNIIEGDLQDVVSAIRSQDCPPNWQLKPFINEAYSC